MTGDRYGPSVVPDCSGIQRTPSLLPCPEEHGAEHEQDDDDDDEYFAHDLRNRHPRFECLEPDVVMVEQPVVKVQLHSTGATQLFHRGLLEVPGRDPAWSS